MIKNKKAAIFLTFVSFLLIIAYIFFITTFNSYAESQPKDFTKQPEILETYQQGEKILLYIDLSAKYSAYKTIHELAFSGELNEKNECGIHDGYVLWNNEEKECFPTKKSLYHTFSERFNLNLDEYLKRYEEPKLITDKVMKQNQIHYIPLNNYDLLFKEGHIIGIATENLKINKPNINYSIKPSFNIGLDYDLFQDYEYLVEKAKEIIEKCSENKEPEESISDCVDSLIKDFNGQKELNVIENPKLEEINEQIEEKEKRLKELEEDKNTNRRKPIYTYDEKKEIEQLNAEIKELENQFFITLGDEEIKIFRWSFEEDGDIFMFSVEQNKEFSIYNSKTKKISEEPITYKFALYLSQTSEVNQ